MTFDVNDALTEGWKRTTTWPAAQLYAALVAIGLAQTIVSDSLAHAVFFETTLLEDVFAEASPGAVDEVRREIGSQVGGVVIDLPLELLGALLVLLPLAGMIVKIGAIRWFVEEDSGGLAPRLFTRRLLWTVVNLIVGGILYGVTVVVGLIFLIAPGIFFAVALFFYNYEIIVEGENAIEALANSWALTKGNRLVLFLLGLLFVVAGWVLGVISGPLAIPDPTIRAVVGTILTTGLTILGIGVAAAAYTQLRAEPDEEVGALGADDLEA